MRRTTKHKKTIIFCIPKGKVNSIQENVFMKSLRILSIFLCALLISCGSKALYLVSKDKVQIASGNDTMKMCLQKSINDMNSGAPNLTEAEKAPLKGINTDKFLWWGSMSGPMPVINRNKQPGEAQSAFPVLDERKIELSERYVLCLLANDYSWPDEEWVKARYNEAN